MPDAQGAVEEGRLYLCVNGGYGARVFRELLERLRAKFGTVISTEL